MPLVPPVAPEDADEDVSKLYDRIAETIGDGAVPVGFQQKGHVKAFLQDSYMNFKKFVTADDDTLSAKQREAVALATSSALNCKSCTKAHAKACEGAGFSEQEVVEILAVTSTCTMYNTYYKFRDLAGDDAFKSKKPQLRAHTFQKTSLDDSLVELINVVVSNINNCPMCTSGHVKKALELGLDHDQIDEAIRVSATMASFNTFHRTQ
ncbi:MAG: carboxymuconolactone decarboxylase family protein [Phycisphaeraceae bacterium]|nr:carboxymuconolactone decarboxylase family protein [Phycisphaeraceae bacterium]